MSYYFDWENKFTTTDSRPDWYREVACVMLDGVEIKAVVRCMTGDDGFVEVQRFHGVVYDEALPDSFKTNIVDMHCVTRIACGKVEVGFAAQ